MRTVTRARAMAKIHCAVVTGGTLAGDRGSPSRVGPQRFGDGDRPVGLSMRLDDRGPDTRHRQCRTVERVHDLTPATNRGLVADVRPASLVVAEPRDRRHLEPLVAAG